MAEKYIEKSCDNCVSRFICPNRHTYCDSWGSKQSFASFLSLCFYGRLSKKDIYDTLIFVEKLQKGEQNK